MGRWGARWCSLCRHWTLELNDAPFLSKTRPLFGLLREGLGRAGVSSVTSDVHFIDYPSEI